MGSLLSSCRKNNNNEEQTLDPALANVDTDGKSYLQYIMNYDSIPYFIPQIKYAKVTDVRQNYTIVVAARFPHKDALIYRFPVKLKHVCNRIPQFSDSYTHCSMWESNLHNKAMNALMPLICSNIVELRDIENLNGELWAEVYCGKLDVSEWLIDNNLAIGSDDIYNLVKQPYKFTKEEAVKYYT